MTSIKWLLLVVMFAPVSMTFGGIGFSANYSFVALLTIGSVRAPERWNPIVSLYVLFCILSYVLGVFIFSSFDASFWLRQSISFIIFLLPIFILFVRMPYSIDDICLAAFTVSCLYSAYTLWIVLSHGIFPITDTFGARAYLTDFVPDYPQRFIIIVLFSVFYGISRAAVNTWYFPVILLLLFSVYISFTRAAWLGLGFGFFAYFFSVLWQARYEVTLRLSVRRFKWIPIISVFVFVTIFVLSANETLREGIVLNLSRILEAFVSFFNDPSSFNPEGSEGIRLQIWSAMIDIVANNPITGTGFAGIHQFLGEDRGSAHSQYMDILLRTGLIGLGFYLFFWGKLLKNYINKPGIFAGLVALFIFGLSHETTKLSYGALLFFLLLNKTYSASIKSRVA
jgi:O-antigen ligase